MSEKAKQRYEETKNKGSETVDGKTAEPIYDLTKGEKEVKAATSAERKDA